MINAMERIRQGIDTLSPSERRVAKYIIDNVKSILNMPISELAKNTDTSEATIIRMCRSLQFKGIRDLKLSLSASMNQEVIGIDRYTDIPINANMTQIIQHVSYNNFQSIKGTMALIDEVNMKKSVELLNNANTISVIGVGASALVALDFEQKCKRINKKCEALTDSHAQLTSAVHLTSKDMILAISYSGETKEIIDTVKIAKKNDVDIISLTSYGDNTVKRLSTISLSVTPIEKVIRSGATSSRIAQLNIVDILFTGLISVNLETSVEKLDKTAEVIKSRFKGGGI